MRERARASSGEPVLNPASREPTNVRMNNPSLRDKPVIPRADGIDHDGPTIHPSLTRYAVDLDGRVLG